MVGARRVHGLVSGNVFAALKLHLKGSPCRAFIEGMKVHIISKGHSYSVSQKVFTAVQVPVKN
mgnify:CR=1 FL=1